MHKDLIYLLRILKFLKCSLFLLPVLSTLIIAKTIYIPKDYGTIQEGIHAALNGDSVVVSNGVYYENIRFNGKAITLASLFLLDDDTTHVAKTIIDGSLSENLDSMSCVYFISGEDTNSVLCGFTIRGGKGTKNQLDGYDIVSGGGIYIKDSGAKIQNNRILQNVIKPQSDEIGIGAGIATILNPQNQLIINDNYILDNQIVASGGRGAGVSLCTDGSVKFLSNSLKNNSCSATENGGAGGGAIYLFAAKNDKYDTILLGNVISENHCTSLRQHENWGGGIFISDCAPVLDNNHIYSNNADLGSGIRITAKPTSNNLKEVVIKNDLIENNFASHAGALSIDRSRLYLENAVVKNNHAKLGAGIAIFEEAKVRAENLTVSGNRSRQKGGGIYIRGQNEFYLHEGHITNNHSGAGGGGGIYCKGRTGNELSNLSLEQVTISDNYAEYESGGAIKCDNFVSLELQSVKIQNNTADKTGGGIYSYYADIELTDVQIVKNKALYDGGGIFRNVGSEITFDAIKRSSIYLNEAIKNGYDIYNNSGRVLKVNVDTFTVKMPTEEYAYPIKKFNFDIKDFITSAEVRTAAVPKDHKLNPNYPNPFNPETKISYQIAKSSKIRLIIFNSLGRTIKTLVNRHQNAGQYEITFNAEDLPSGIYFYQLTTQTGYSQTRKMVVLK